MSTTLLPSTIPAHAFLEPGQRNESARQLVDQTLDRMWQFLASPAAHRPMPASIGPLPDTLIPETGDSDAELLQAVDLLIAGSANFAAAGHVGHMDPTPSVASVAGNALAGVLNNNMLSREMSPILSDLEEQLTRELARDWFGLGPQSGGVLQGGGSLCNLLALTAARNSKLDVARRGLFGLPRRPVVLGSELAHTSLQKAAMVLGLGSEGVRLVRADRQARMDVDDLKSVIASCRAAGEEPFALVATAGTTVHGSVDPIPEIASVTQREGLWLHVDAAYGGGLIFSDGHRGLLAGIDQADSVTFNPQKWCFVTRTCAMVLFRDEPGYRQAVRIVAPYMDPDVRAMNLGEIGLQGTRGTDILKLWLTLRHLGWRGLAELVDAAMATAAALADALEQEPAVELDCRPQMNILCFRARPPRTLSAEAADRWQRDLRDHLLRQANLYYSLPLVRGRRWLKGVLLNTSFGPEQIDQTVRGIREFVRAT